MSTTVSLGELINARARAGAAVAHAKEAIERAKTVFERDLRRHEYVCACAEYDRALAAEAAWKP